MLFYSEDDLTPLMSKKVNDLIGKQIPLRAQIKKGTVGSHLYRLRRFTFYKNLAQVMDLNSRCTFEKFEKGFLLRINDRQKLYSVAIPYNSIDQIEIKKGEENIHPIIFSPMWFLLKLGMHIRYARYFMIKLLEYSVDPMVLRMKAGETLLELDSNGYNYHGELKYFEKVINLCQNSDL